MNQPYIKPVFVGYLVLMAVIGIFSNNFVIKAEEPVAQREFQRAEKIYQLEMKNANFDEIINDVLKDDVKYTMNPAALAKDIELSELVSRDLDYLSYGEQRVHVEVTRFTESQAGKVVFDKMDTYVTVQFIDTIAPEITLNKESVEFDEGESFNAKDYVEAITDNSYDEVELDIDDSVDMDEPGTYTVTYTATDKSGNSSTATLEVIVNEVEEEEEIIEVVEEPKAKTLEKTQTPVAATTTTANLDVSGSAIANAALAQLGRYQDCTMLVTRSLAAVGISHHSGPAGYIGLGTIVSAADARPGDLIYYADGGYGMAHIAVYIGGGQAVHGGWHGNQTVIQSAYVAGGATFIRI